jgi:histidinol-phosphatase (PHP family)
MNMNQPKFVSVHGGHSGEFCDHAEDSLEDIIKAYIAKGFSWVGIAEHMPPPEDRFLYPEQKASGTDSEMLYQDFAKYISVCRELQKKYAAAIRIFVGFETETYTGAVPFIRQLTDAFQPDYIVGSVHHVNDLCFDSSQTDYDKAVRAVGGTDALYCRYFDQQYEMIRALTPAVVGHFDLIRLFDPDYSSRLEKPAIQQRIRRNLECVRDFNLILDFNLRALYKGAKEPYVSESLLAQALELGIDLVPGDDSHGVESVGGHMEDGIKILEKMGFSTDWRTPAD